MIETRVERRKAERAIYHVNLELIIFFGMMFVWFIGAMIFG